MPPTRPQHPASRAPGSWSGPGKEVKVSGGWWKGRKDPAGRGAETQNAQDGSPCQHRRQLGAEDPGEGQRKKVKRWQPRGGRNAPGTASLAAPGLHRATPYLKVWGTARDSLGGAGLGCHCLQPAASGIKGFPISSLPSRGSLLWPSALAPRSPGCGRPPSRSPAVYSGSQAPLHRLPASSARAHTSPGGALLSKQATRPVQKDPDAGQLQKIRLKPFICATRFKELFASISRLHWVSSHFPTLGILVSSKHRSETLLARHLHFSKINLSFLKGRHPPSL